ncbi:MAG: hypothetical protein KA436_01755 [Oligoflexales bacterium]|nr:hypothetical protein [Oligoflexales bacterium]
MLEWFQQHHPELMNQANQNGNTPVHFASLFSHLMILDWFHQHYPELIMTKLMY